VTADLVCPRCRAPLAGGGAELACSGCGATYPVVAEIPDLRTAPDPWIGLEADRAKGLAVDAAVEPGAGFEAAVRAYWARTPDTPPHRAARHIDHVLRAEARTSEWVAHLDPPARAGEHWLDLGCGTADLACVAPEGVRVASLDVAFRWLVVARRRLAGCGRDGGLVCGNAETLPYPDAVFDRVVALGTLEHCRDAVAALAEARRVLKPGGSLQLRTVNRFSLLPEPHVGVWGVGWLPRRWADGYVRWRTGEHYLHHRLLSAAELRRALAAAGFRGIRIAAARMLDVERERLPGPLRAVTPAYEALRRAPITRVAGRWFAPMLEASASA
jgi:SAM-dependent methyltransferase